VGSIGSAQVSVARLGRDLKYSLNEKILRIIKSTHKTNKTRAITIKKKRERERGKHSNHGLIDSTSVFFFYFLFLFLNINLYLKENFEKIIMTSISFSSEFFFYLIDLIKRLKTNK
jgi:hypothetical protein